MTVMKPIRASDIGAYLYCRRAWWYRQIGQESINQAEMAAGSDLHRRHGRKVMTAGLLRALGFVLLLVACILLTAFGLANFLGGA
jgi:CRISPR/Cas system-associated exonuclease Cas4 (RecB family)